MRLLGCFEMRIDDRLVDVPVATQRVVAFVALHRRVVQRSFVAGTLWGESSEERALGSLRSALWRMPGGSGTIIRSTATGMRLADDVRVDITEHEHAARMLAKDADHVPAEDVSALEHDLLPDWLDDWIIGWRDRWHQVRLHALDLLARAHAAAGRFGQALEAAEAALRADPLRESAHRTCIEVHLAEGNTVEAMRQYRRCCQILRSELGVGPSPLLRSLVARPGGDDAHGARAAAQALGPQPVTRLRVLVPLEPHAVGSGIGRVP
jgi:DNA-binding SARP family transcriptional activator